jgi:ABC-type transporter Mla MlaB component
VSTPTYQTIPITCPQCGNRFITPVLSIVDVGQSPQVKTLFLSGRLNVAVCPQCGNAGVLSTPLVYHDPDKELLLTFMPPELGGSEMEQQRIIGEMTNRVISTLPAEKRKGYLLRPRSFLRLQAMVEAILEADGITPEMLEAQRAKADLLQRLLQTSGEESRKIVARENDELIDYEFFQLLSLNLEMAQSEGQDTIADDLLALRGQLLEWTTLGHKVAAQEKAIESLSDDLTREELLDKLVEAARAGEEDQVEAMVAFGRPAIDYIFYQQLTSRIDAAIKSKNAQESQTLTSLRETILDLTAQIDAEMQRATQESAQFLQEVLDSDDPEQVLRSNLEQVDDLFMSVLASALERAQKSGETARLEELEEVSSALLQLIQESQPPEIRFINQLLSAEYPEATQAMLEENRDLVDERLLELMSLIGSDFDQRGRSEVAQRLEQIREQAAALLT